MITNNSIAQKMLEGYLLPKFQKFEILNVNNNNSFDVKITIQSTDVFAVIQCDISYEQDKLHVVNLSFTINHNFEYIYMILDVFNKDRCSLVKETLHDAFNIFNSTITEISVNIPLDRFEKFHIDVYGYGKKSPSTKWGMGFYDDDSKDLKVIEFLYKISSEVMEEVMGCSNVIYDGTVENEKSYEEFIEDFDTNNYENNLLEKYRTINHQELSDLIGMNKI